MCKVDGEIHVENTTNNQSITKNSAAFRLAGLDEVPFVWVTVSEISGQMWR